MLSALPHLAHTHNQPANQPTRPAIHRVPNCGPHPLQQHTVHKQAQVAFPDLAKAAEAVRRTFRILRHQSVVDPSAGGGAMVEVEGTVELQRVAFAYPSRPQRLILKEFNLTVPAGTSCALVSGSSSAGQLIG